MGVGVAVVFTGPGVIAPFLQIGRSHDALGNRPILQTNDPPVHFFPLTVYFSNERSRIKLKLAAMLECLIVLLNSSVEFQLE